MTNTINRTNFYVAAVVTLSVTCVWFWLTWRWGFDLADEGYYWYGAQRILQGEIPIRDFMSYDIGRYYWAAAFMHLLGDDGLFAARVSAACYQALGVLLGVFICLLAAHRQGPVQWLFALLVCCILTIWTRPYYKAYDHATSIFVVAMLVLMLKTSKPATWLLAGIALGIAAIMGRNHGMYGATASIFVMSILLIKAPSKKALVGLCGYFVLGVFVGFSPTLIMMLAIDGFMAAFVNSIVLMVKYGATNITLPVPWPWFVKLGEVDILLTLQDLAIGFGFLLLLLFPLIGIISFAASRADLSSDARKVFLATTASAVLYAHYAFSRADLTHLTLGIFPAMIGLLVAGGLMKGLRPLLAALGLLAFSLVAAPPTALHSLIQKNWVETDIAGEHIWINPDISKRLYLVDKELQEVTSRSGKFLALPDLPSVHAIFHTRMSIWEIYPLVPRSPDFERSEIKRLESSLPELVLLSNHALDGNPEFRYSQMHPLTYRWLTSNYALSNSMEMHGVKIFTLRH